MARRKSRVSRVQRRGKRSRVSRNQRTQRRNNRSRVSRNQRTQRRNNRSRVSRKRKRSKNIKIQRRSKNLRNNFRGGADDQLEEGDDQLNVALREMRLPDDTTYSPDVKDDSRLEKKLMPKNLRFRNRMAGEHLWLRWGEFVHSYMNDEHLDSDSYMTVGIFRDLSDDVEKGAGSGWQTERMFRFLYNWAHQNLSRDKNSLNRLQDENMSDAGYSPMERYDNEHDFFMQEFLDQHFSGAAQRTPKDHTGNTISF